MATGKKTQIVITANAATAKKVMDELQQRIDALKQKMQALDTTTAQGQKEFKKLEKELVSYNSAVAQNITNEERVKKAIGDLANTSLKDLRRALSSAKTLLGQTFQNDPNLKKRQQDVKTLQQQIDKLTGSVHKNGNAWQTAVKNLTAYAGLFQAFGAIKNTVTSAIKKNLEYSGSLTDIRKVAGLTMEDINELSRRLTKIDTRTGTEGLAKLAYEGAKLGMSKYGVEGMEGFVKAADQINVAIGEEMGEQALPALSKMVETMGLIPKMGIEKAMLATGSAMFKLSSTSTSTSGNIVEFAKRLTGVSRTAGITTDQLLALGSASDSLFLMPEVSATAMSKFIVALQKNHNLIEKDLGIQQGTIKQMYAAGHAMDAIVLVLERMRDKGNMNALGGIFKDLGSDGQRLVTAMVTMAKNVDVLKDHLYESQEAFAEATAVTSEYEMQQTSAIGILERANNLWEKAFVNPEGVDSVKTMAQAWYDISQTILNSPIFKGTLNASLYLVIQSCKTFVTLLPLITNYLLGMGIWKAATFFWDLSKAIWAACTAQNALNTSAKVNPYVAIASVITTAVGVFWSYANAASEAAKAEEEAQRKANAWKDKLKDAQRETDTLTQKLHSYKTTLTALNVSQAERNTQIARFNRDFRQYINKLGIEIKNVSDLKTHYSELAQEIQRATYYRLREEAKQNAMPKLQTDRLNAANRIKKELDGLGLFAGGFTQKNVMDMFNKGAGAGWIWQQIIKANTKDAKQDSFNFDMKTGKYTYTSNDGKVVKNDPVGYKNLLSALVHYQNATKRETAKDKEINDYFAPFVPEDYTPWVEDTPGTLENDAPDKEAIRREKQEKREQMKAWRDELKQKQDEAKAIMDDVGNYYDRQINARIAKAISLGMNEGEQSLYTEPLKSRKNEALSQVRLAVAGKPNGWETFKKSMSGDMVEGDDETGYNASKDLLSSITKNNIDALRKLMAQLGSNLGVSMNSITSEIFAKSTKNQQSNLTLAAKQAETRRKVAQENDYMGVVQKNSYDDFNTMGYANLTTTEESDKTAFDERKKNIVNMFEAAREQIGSILALDMADEADHGLLMTLLFGKDPDGMAARIQSVLGDDVADWQVFYHKLIQYSDEYTVAQKKTYDQQKKIADQMWAVNKRNLSALDQQRKLQGKQNMFGKQTSYWSELGLSDVKNDPEVMLMKARLQAAEDYYYFIEKNSKNKQLLDEADKSRHEAELAYTKQLVTAMQDRLSKMQSLVQPIETFGAEVGKAFATMRDSVSDAHEAIKDALKSMVETWANMAINDVSKQMWQAINNAGAVRASKKANPDIEAAQQTAATNASVSLEWRNLGTADNPMWVRISGNQMVDANGTPLSEGEPPAAWSKRHPDGTIDDYNRESFGIEPPASNGANAGRVGNALTGAGSQVGAAVADTATGGSSLADAAAGIGGSLVNGVMNMDFTVGGKQGGAGASGGSSSDKNDDKAKKDALKKEKKHQKALTKELKQGTKDREKETKKGVKNITDETEQGNTEQQKGTELAQTAITAAVTKAATMNLATKQTNNKAVAAEDAALAQTETTFSIVGAVGKCFEFLGPIAGPIAAATVTATLMGLLQWALSSAFSSKKSSSSSGTNTKLVTGMLTYDSGNVQDLKPFVADNGEVYWAKEDEAPQQSGVQMLSTPTATTINGQPSLVAERGPEIVIGRETTQAMMMNNPQLLKALINYDRNYSGRTQARRAYDEGNVSAVLSVADSNVSGASATDNSMMAAASNNALLQAVNILIQRLNEPITAKVDMYGRGNLYDSMTKATQFMKNKT